MGSIPLRTLLLGNSLNNPTYPPSRDLELGRYEVDGDYPVDGAGRLLQCPGDVASGVAGFPPLPQLLLARLRQSWTTQPSQAHTSDPNIIENLGCCTDRVNPPLWRARRKWRYASRSSEGFMANHFATTDRDKLLTWPLLRVRTLKTQA